MTAECMADAKGAVRMRKLKERILHIDAQILELKDKREIMENEIEELERSK